MGFGKSRGELFGKFGDKRNKNGNGDYEDKDKDKDKDVDEDVDEDDEDDEDEDEGEDDSKVQRVQVEGVTDVRPVGNPAALPRNPTMATPVLTTARVAPKTRKIKVLSPVVSWT